MERQDLLNFLRTCYKNLAENDMEYDLNEPDELRVINMRGPLSFIPSRDINGENYYLLVLTDQEGQDAYTEYCGSDETWPFFENDLRDELVKADVPTTNTLKARSAGATIRED